MKYALVIFALILSGHLLISCGTRDDRNDIRAQYGEPDAVQRSGFDPYWSEIWFYRQIGVAFEFRRTSGCGSTRDVYLYFSYPISIDTSRTDWPKAKSDTTKHFGKTLWPVAPR
ncbi:MAG: hypothetical protein ONB44_23645 [candidate division KSB1 bacterium]|nr:hypothetical protein [candidate division KSB1 bacterium]MDZ7305137.1 hypothetical protein [candidate division KSB1 bacterium]MDZ7314221.1 hypothetical protein [candidate division KSB1 bacterium]